MVDVAPGAVLLFGYAFLSNVALAVVPHEPAVIWYGARLGILPTTLVATAGTVLAAFADHTVFVPLIERIAARRSAGRGGPRGVPAAPLFPERVFRHFPFAVIALSGLTPLPFLPFKALAFATGYPIGKYACAVVARCLPRYALLAWLGNVARVPAWLFVALSALLMIPSLRMVLWPTRAAN
jgi:membrane protein YqaA with SNARE-associated domain